MLPWRNIEWGKIRSGAVQTITVTGEAKSKQEVQSATFTAGVTQFDNDKDKAIKDVNDKINQLVTAVKNFGIKPEDIQTQSISYYQNQESYWDNGVQKMRAGQWSVSNQIEIKLHDLNNADKLADLLAKSGANNVYGPNFSVDDTQQVETEMMSAAMSNARVKAEALAKAGAKQLGQIVSVTEGPTSSSGQVMYARGMGGGGSEASAMEPGSQSVTKTVVVVYELK